MPIQNLISFFSLTVLLLLSIWVLYIFCMLIPDQIYDLQISSFQSIAFPMHYWFSLLCGIFLGWYSLICLLLLLFSLPLKSDQNSLCIEYKRMVSSVKVTQAMMYPTKFVNVGNRSKNIKIQHLQKYRDTHVCTFPAAKK